MKRLAFIGISVSLVIASALVAGTASAGVHKNDCGNLTTSGTPFGWVLSESYPAVEGQTETLDLCVGNNTAVPLLDITIDSILPRGIQTLRNVPAGGNAGWKFKTDLGPTTTLCSFGGDPTVYEGWDLWFRISGGGYVSWVHACLPSNTPA